MHPTLLFQRPLILQCSLLSHVYLWVHHKYTITPQSNYPQVKYKIACKKPSVIMLPMAQLSSPICLMLLLQVGHPPKQQPSSHVCTPWRKSLSHIEIQPPKEVYHMSIKSRSSNPWVSYLLCVSIMVQPRVTHITWSTPKHGVRTFRVTSKGKYV